MKPKYGLLIRENKLLFCFFKQSAYKVMPPILGAKRSDKHTFQKQIKLIITINSRSCLIENYRQLAY